MIKLKHLIQEQELTNKAPVSDFIRKTSTKTINDEFEVNDRMLKDIEKMLMKVNKKLKARNLPELKLKIINSRWVDISKGKKTKSNINDPFVIKKLIHTVKVEGKIPEIKDYEFIAKIEHGEDGNIINMAPNSSIKKLPDKYKTGPQTCDVCHTDRDRNNTFIIKNVSSGDLICAGSSCLKKFMPLDAVKAMVDYSIQLNDLRNALRDYEISTYNNNDGNYYYGSGNIETQKELYEPETVLAYCLIAYFNSGGEYISRSKAKESGKPSTLGQAISLINALNYYGDDEYEIKERDKAKQIVNKYKDKATIMTKKILSWAKSYDFDKAAIENPKMDSYYHNLKILLNRKSLELKHLGYFSSLISLYLKEMNIKSQPKEIKNSEYYGKVGEKIVDVPVEVTFITSFDTQYGITHVYNMVDKNDHIFVYKGKILELPGRSVIKGDKILLSGTIKAHQEYKGKKQTIIIRPKIKEI